MATRAVQWNFTGATIPYSAYDSTKTVVGDLIKQYTGSNAEDKFAGPIRTGRDSGLTTNYAVARPVETTGAVPGFLPQTIQWAAKKGYYSTGTVGVSGTTVTGTSTAWLTAGVPINAVIGFNSTDPGAITTWYPITALTSDTVLTIQSSPGTIGAGASYVINMTYNIDWVFLVDNAAAGTNRRMILYEFNRDTSIYAWKGFITQTYPIAVTHTCRGSYTVLQNYTTGTVAVSGATVTGTSTTWSTDRIFIGSRIGFGSTDPTQISTWYYINAVGSNTSITIQTNVTAAGTGGTAANITVASSTAYVIEDLKILNANTNGTLADGGLFMSAGVSHDDFTTTGTTIASAVATDLVKASYWLADAAVVTNTTTGGLAVDTFSSMTSQSVYLSDGGGSANAKFFKYNFRHAMTLASGKDTTCFLFATAAQAVTGNIAQNNNLRLATTAHGPGSGTACFYFVTASRIVRATYSNVTTGASNFIADQMTEIPTGGVATYTASGTMTSIDYMQSIDRFIITTTGAQGATLNNRAYLTQYNASSNPIDTLFLIDSRQIDQSTEDNNACPHPSVAGAMLTTWSQGGLLYIVRTGTTAATNILYVIPLGADWDYTGSTNHVLITPALTTSNAVHLSRVMFSDEDYIGGGGLRIPTEGTRVSYRTSGISDNSGSWTLCDNTGDLSGATAGTQVQFKFEFRTAGTFCVPSRIYNVACLYEDSTTDGHYQPSVGQSSTSNKYFAWRFSTAFGGTVPKLRIRLFDAVTGGTLLDDDSVTKASTWEKSTDGGSTWGAYNTTDKANETTYIRLTPASLADNIKVRALLTQF